MPQGPTSASQRLLPGIVTVVIVALVFTTVIKPEVSLALLAVIAVAAALYIAWHVPPAYLISAAVALSMFSGWWDQIGLPSLLAPDRLLLLASLPCLVLRGPGAADRPPFRMNWVHVLMILFSVYLLLSSAWSGTALEFGPLFVLVDRVGLVPFLLFAVAPYAFYLPAQRRALLGTLVGMGAYLSYIGLADALDLNGLIFPSYINDPALGIHPDRARGPFLEAEGQGLALGACAIACCMASVLWARQGARIFARVVLVMCLVAMFLTLARAVWLGAIVATILTMVSVTDLRRYVLPALLAGVAAIALALIALPALRTQAVERAGEQLTVYDRQNQQATALRMIADNPVVGVGWGRYGDTVEPYIRTAPDMPLTGLVTGTDSSVPQIVHNAFLSIGVEAGLLGVAVWVLLIYVVSVPAFRTTSNRAGRTWKIGYRAFLPLWITVALFTPLLKPTTCALLFLWAGVLRGFDLHTRSPLKIRREITSAAP